jgi:hypothetical protein
VEAGEEGAAMGVNEVIEGEGAAGDDAAGEEATSNSAT